MPQRLPHASVWPIRSWTRNMIAHHGVSSVLSLWWSKSCSRIFKRSGGKIPRTDYWFISFRFQPYLQVLLWQPTPVKVEMTFPTWWGGWTTEQSNVIIQIHKENYFPANHGELQNVVKIPILLCLAWVGMGLTGFECDWMPDQYGIVGKRDNGLCSFAWWLAELRVIF